MTLDTTNAVLIPTLSDGSTYYTTRVNLDGSDYDLAFSYAQREGRWYVDIYDAAVGTLLTAHLKVVLSWPMLRYYHHIPNMPAGELLCLTRTSNDSPPGIGDMGEGLRCELSYFPLTGT